MIKKLNAFIVKQSKLTEGGWYSSVYNKWVYCYKFTFNFYNWSYTKDWIFYSNKVSLPTSEDLTNNNTLLL